MIRRLTDADFGAILAVVNDAAEAYRGVIPADCWKQPYMPAEELKREIEHGVAFSGYEEPGGLVGVMGVQEVRDVTLIRHAYVRTDRRGSGVGGRLLEQLRSQLVRPVLVGTWAAAVWAIGFYQKHGFRLVDPATKDRLLRTYWTISDRQVECSVVLADATWWAASGPAPGP